MIEKDYSPLTASLVDAPPASLSDFFEQLEDSYDSAGTNQVELAALIQNDAAVLKLLEGASLYDKVMFLHAHLESKEGGDFLQLWGALDGLERAAQAAKVHALIEAFDDGQINALVAEISRIPEISEGIDFKWLTSGFVAMRDHALALAEMQVANQFAFSFLRGLIFFVMGRIECPTNFWQILLLKMEHRFLPDGMHPETSPLFPCFRIAENNLFNQPALHEFCLLSEEVEDAEEVAANIACLAFIHSAPSNYRRVLFSDLDAEFFYSLKISGPFSDPTAPWRSALHNRLERAFSDLFVEAADRGLELQRQLSCLINESPLRTKISQEIAADLSQGMKAGNISRHLEENCQRLMNAAACSQLIGENMIEAKDLFIQSSVSSLGIEPQVEVWRKHSQLLSRLAMATREMESALDWDQIARLFTQLDKRIQDMHARPVDWLKQRSLAFTEEMGLSNSDLEYYIKLGQLTAARIAIDERRYGSRWKKTVRLWSVESLFSGEARHDFERLEIFLSRFFNQAEIVTSNDRSLEVGHLKAQASTFSSELLRVAVASSLFRASHAIATEVADEVIEALPDYALRIGANGRASCISDNQITLQKVAEFILESEEDPAEQLTEWWTSLVGSYLATRPEQLFELNLNALYRGIKKHLSEAHADMAFAPIQAMYNESLGVNCVEALASRPLAPIGPLVEVYCQRGHSESMDLLLSEQPSVVSTLSLADLEPDSIGRVGELLSHFHADLWKAGAPDLAAARILPALNRLELKGQWSKLAASLRRGAEDLPSYPSALLFQLSAESFGKLLVRQALADQIDAHAASIAAYYSEAMHTYAPEFFEHLTKEDAMAKCSRDQLLLIRKFAQFLRHSTPELFWFDLTRYFLELQSSHVSYPEKIWAMSFRTLSKSLGKHLSAIENLEIVELIDVAEQIAVVWCDTHNLAKHCFDPSDYTFSAKAEKDLWCRDILTALLVGDAMGRCSREGAASFFRRFFLSSALGACDEGLFNDCFDTVRERASSYLSPRQIELLEQMPGILKDFSHGYREASTNLEGLASNDLISREYQRLVSGAQVLQELPEIGGTHSRAVVNMMLRAHYRAGASDSQERSVSETYTMRLNASLISYFCSLEVLPDDASLGILQNELLCLRDAFASDDRMTLQLDECQRAIFHAVKAAHLITECEAEASRFLSELSSGRRGTYHEGDETCKSTTADSFSYVFKTAAAAWMQPQLNSPKLFFSRASENHRSMDLAVSANAHAKTCLRLSELLPGSGLTAFAPAGDLMPVRGLNWNKVAYATQPFQEPVLAKIDQSALAKVFGAEDKVSASLGGILSVYVAELRDHGDWEAALARCSVNIDDLLSRCETSEVFAALQSAGIALANAFDCGAYLFWSLHFRLLESQIQQVALGRVMSAHGKQAAEDYVNHFYSEAQGGDPERCLRDQTYLLALASAAMRSLGPVAALQNILQAYVEYVLPHLKNSSLELSHNWTYYENWFLRKLPVDIRPTALAHFGLLADAFGRSTKLKEFVALILPDSVKEISGAYGLRPYEVEQFLTSISAASLAGGSKALMLLERVLLGTPLARHIGVDVCKAFFEGLETVLEASAEGRVPNLLKSVVLELPRAYERLHEAADSSGSNLSRFCIANAHSEISRALWKASNLARYSFKERLIEPDRNDAKLARVLGSALLEDEALEKELSAYRRFVSNLPTAAYPEKEEEKRSGLLGFFGAKKREEEKTDWRDNKVARQSVELAYYQLVGDSILGLESSPLHIQRKTLQRSAELCDSRTCIEVHQALLQGLVKEQGSTNLCISQLQRYVDSLSALLASNKLLDTNDSSMQYYGLYLAGLRTVNHGIFYFRGRNPDAELKSAERLLPNDIDPTSLDKIRSVTSEIVELCAQS